jgi:hypothetical protein
VTRQGFCPDRGLRFAVLFVIFAFAILAALTASAQQSGVQTSPNFARTVAMHDSTKPSQQWQQVAAPGSSPSQTPPHGPKRRAGDKEGSGSLSFEAPVTYGSGGSIPQVPAIADVNGDGIPDIVVSNYYQKNGDAPGVVGVLLGNGDGTFQSAVVYETGGAPNYYVVIADVNGDGKPDIIVSSCAATGSSCGSADGVVSVLLGNGNGTFQNAVTYSTGAPRNGGLAVADLTGNGVLDLIATNYYGEANGDGSVSVLLGNGDGTFQSAVNYDAGTSQINGVAVGDVNGDGKPDVVTVSYTGLVSVLLGNGNGTFQPAVTYSAGGSSSSGVALADLNGDGYLDVIAGNLSGNVGVLLNQGNGTFYPAVSYDGAGAVPQLAVADLNLDGNLDVIVSTDGSTVGVLLGNGDGTLQAVVTFPSGGSDENSVAVSDLTGDGWPDIVVTNGYSNTVGVLINNTASATTTTVASSLNPSNYGQSVTFVATVTSSSGTPTGTVVFYNGPTAIGSATLSNGSASFSTSSLPQGADSITATYQGSSGFGSSTSAVLTQVVVGITTATSLGSSLNPSTYGQLVTFAATVTSGSGTPTGSVIFYDGTTAIGSVTLSNGSASFSSSSLPAGSNSITAAYQGSSSFAPSTSAVVTQVVTLSNTTTALASSVDPAKVDQHVTYTATVTGQYGGAVTGTVTFQDNGVTVATVGVSSNQATFTTKYRAAGIQVMSAIYSGDSNDQGSTSSVLVEDVGKVPYASKTTVTTSGSPSPVGQPVTFTANVTSKDGTIPDGETVTFYADSKEIGTGTTSGGVASFTTSSLTAKTWTIKATYSGDSTFKESSGIVKQVVTP